MDFVEICNVCARKAIIKAAKRIFNSDKICRSYCNFYFGGPFLEHSEVVSTRCKLLFVKMASSKSKYNDFLCSSPRTATGPKKWEHI